MNFLLSSEAVTGSTWESLCAGISRAFSGFGVFDVIGIFLLVALCLLAFRFFIIRRGRAIAAGIAVCLAMLVSAGVLGVCMSNGALSAAFGIGALAILIIFQPEIRDAIDRFSSGARGGMRSSGDQKKKQQLYYKAIDSVCTAVGELARTKTGALIVLARTTSLEDIVQTGITINADVNSYLIRNLFFNKAPLHDGAVVIEDAKITAAGCLLPLTRRFDIDGDLGTRHRAALGMSETSDAIIVVVSEETGVISIAHECTLTRNYTYDALRAFLMRKLIRDDKENKNSERNG